MVGMWRGGQMASRCILHGFWGPGFGSRVMSQPKSLHILALGREAGDSLRPSVWPLRALLCFILVCGLLTGLMAPQTL